MDRLIALVALRWRLELRGLARARERAAGLLLLFPFLLLGSAITAVLVFVAARALERSRPELVLPVASVAATVIGVFWVLSPLLGGVAFTESHDLQRLLHFPLPLTTLIASSLLANLAQPMVLLRLPVLLALSAALAGDAARFPLVLAGVCLSFAFMLAADQVAGLLLHAVSRNRRLQDVAMFLGLGLGFLVSVAPVLLLAGGGNALGALASFVTATDVFAASPFAWGIRSAVHVARGETLPFLAQAALGALGIVAAVALSTALARRIYRGELDLGAPGASAARARMLLPGTLGALVEKDLRAAWRDPAIKATLLVGFVGPVFFLFLLTQSPGTGPPGKAVLFLASVVGISTFGANAFGLERRGITLLMGFPVPRWKILVAKNLGAMVLRLPGLATLLVAGLLLAPPALLPAVAAIVLSTFLIASGLDNYMSILFPVVMPAAGRSPLAGGGARGRGLGVPFLATLLLAVTLCASSPFAFLAWLPILLDAPGLFFVSLPLAVAGAGSVYAMLVAGAARLLSRREPDLLQRILGEE